jgi:hypothetical protein
MSHFTLGASATFALPLVVLAAACGSSEQRRGWDGQPGVPASGSAPSFSSSNNDANKGDSGEAPGAATYIPPTELGCSSRAQEILILDFRSGWWAGGGGGPFTGTALTAVVGACPATKVDYHHFETQMHLKCVYRSGNGGGCVDLNPAVTVTDIIQSFEEKSAADYTQIWVLSGSDQDKSDIPVGDALFQGVFNDTKGACIPMLVAAGDGFVTHANSIAADFGIGQAFKSRTNPPSFFSVGLSQAHSTATIAAPKLTQHLLFQNVPSITDSVANSIQHARGDTLAASAPGPAIYDVIAQDSDGNPTIAVGAAKLAGDGYRPFIFDSGWQRMYTLGQDPGTDQYLKNLVMWMGLVGCKAAPIGPPK